MVPDIRNFEETGEKTADKDTFYRNLGISPCQITIVMSRKV